MTALKQELIALGKLLYNKNLSPATSGNISYKQENSVIISASGTSLGHLDENKLVSIDFEGKTLEKDKKPSSERFMHTEIYKQRPDVKCIIHSHPPMVTAFAVANQPINYSGLAEAVILLGEVPVADYATPSSDKLAKIIANSCKNHDIVLMANHGVVVCGKSIENALHKIETLQAAAETYLWAKVLGKIVDIKEEDKKELLEIRKTLDF